MSSLFEVVFENVVKSNVIRLLMLLIAGAGRITNIQCSENIRLIIEGDLDVKALDSVLSFHGDVTVLINLVDMKIGGVTLPKVLLRWVKYGDLYDIDFNFDSNDLEDMGMMNLVTALHGDIKEIAKDNGVVAFFGGMEPASDEDTRYFTNDVLGPLSS